MKWFYTVLEFTTIFALITYGEDMGTRNTWYLITAMCAAHIMFTLLYKLRRHDEIKKRTAHNTVKVPSPVELLANENAGIKIRHIYDDETGKDRVLCDFAKS